MFWPQSAGVEKGGQIDVFRLASGRFRAANRLVGGLLRPFVRPSTRSSEEFGVFVYFVFGDLLRKVVHSQAVSSSLDSRLLRRPQMSSGRRAAGGARLTRSLIDLLIRLERSVSFREADEQTLERKAEHGSS